MMRIYDMFQKYPCRRYMIPEIQREYVWGRDEMLLGQFLDSCIDGKCHHLGFLYYSKRSEEEFWIIDGQQRLTTIMLVSFILAWKRNELREFRAFISQEGNDDMLRFSYRVRYETELFLRRLFFSDIPYAEDLPAMIKNQNWFASSWASDPTIANMLNAFRIIVQKTEGTDLDFRRFLESLSFSVFDVGKASQGDDIYIYINSRGLSLNDTERLKPLLFAHSSEKDRHGHLWEEWEEELYGEIKSFTKEEQPAAIVDSMLDTLINAIYVEKTELFVSSINSEMLAEKVFLDDIEDTFRKIRKLKKKYPGIYKVLLKSKDRRVFDVKDPENHILIALLINSEKPELWEFLVYCVKSLIKRGRLDRMDKEEFFAFCRNPEKALKGIFFPEVISTYDDSGRLFDKKELYKLYVASLSADATKAIWAIIDENLVDGSLLDADPMVVWHEKFSDDSYTLWTEADTEELLGRFRIFSMLFAAEGIRKDLSACGSPGRIDNALLARAILAIDEDYCRYIKYSSYGPVYTLGYDTAWKKIFSSKEKSKAVSDLIGRLYFMGVQTEEEIIKGVNLIIEERANEVPEYLEYILREPCSLVPASKGHNLLCFETDEWASYGVLIMEGDNFHSYYINAYTNIVRHRMEGKKNEKVYMYEHGFIPAERGSGWVIMETEKLKAEYIIARLSKKYEVRGEEGKSQVFVKKGMGEDLIEQGVAIMNLLNC